MQEVEAAEVREDVTQYQRRHQPGRHQIRERIKYGRLRRPRLEEAVLADVVGRVERRMYLSLRVCSAFPPAARGWDDLLIPRAAVAVVDAKA